MKAQVISNHLRLQKLGKILYYQTTSKQRYLLQTIFEKK